MPLVVAAQVADPDAAFGAVVVTPGARHCPAAAADDAGARGNVSARAGGRRAAARPASGADAARVYTANTLGAIAGALAAGFVFDPGARPAIDVPDRRDRSPRSAAPSASRAALRATRCRSPTDQAPRAGHGATLIVAGGRRGSRRSPRFCRLPPWDRELLASGAYKYAPYLGSEQPRDRAARRRRSSTTRKARRRRSASAASPARRRSPSTARSTRRTPATC